MKKKVFIVVYLLILVLFSKLMFSYIYNEVLKDKFKSGDHSISTGALEIANFYQPYIAHYNKGNICYEQKDYDEAIKEYNIALSKNPPEKKECSIRINLALSMIGKIPKDYNSKDNLDSTLTTLKEARKVLLEDGCANEAGNGHSAEAEKLKKEIDDLIEELEKKDEEKQDENQEQDENQDSQSSPTDAEEEYIQNLEQQFQEMQEESYDEREEELQKIDELYNQDYNFFDEGGIW